jgi:hypothetical protein
VQQINALLLVPAPAPSITAPTTAPDAGSVTPPAAGSY